MTLPSALAGCLLWFAALGGVPGACADELVQIAPHRTAVWPGNSETTPPLLGFLTRPNGPGRFPAVVLLHSCSGFSGHDTETPVTLKSWGYLALVLDSLGDANMCTVAGAAAVEVFDAYIALRYLAAQSFVASSRVAVMGYSMGAIAAIAANERDGIARDQQTMFRAVVAYYPLCQHTAGILTAPGLILIGERDDWAPADACRKLAAHETDIGITRTAGAGALVELVVYPDATHGFDARLPPRRYLGHFEQYDEAATQDAGVRVRAFLRQELGDQPEN